MIRDIFLGFIPVHVLYHASHGPVYGLSMIEELGRHGYGISPGTLYPLLHKMQASGYLKREDRLVNGKVRKYYSCTAAGRKALKEAQALVKELADEVLEKRGVRRLPLS
jgi:PadR family transcriptional regulator, regulatory protein PadR